MYIDCELIFANEHTPQTVAFETILVWTTFTVETSQNKQLAFFCIISLFVLYISKCTITML